MTWNEYLNYTQEILSAGNPAAPYDNPDYLDYTKMNDARMRRWLKTNPITEETINTIRGIHKPQHWVVITEPWCGDAAHITPILYLMSELNDRISMELQLRDAHSEIDHYQTNGTKSIPILIVRDEAGKDLFHWGPRPADAQQMFHELKERNADFEEIKFAIQNYYNNDKSISIQQEVTTLLREHL